MYTIFSALLFIMMAPDTKSGATTNSGFASTEPPVEVSLSELRWENRVLLIFTDDENSPEFIRQAELLDSDPDGLEVRKLVRFVFTPGDNATFENRPLSEESAQDIRSRYADDAPFTFILIGKDGGEKMHSHEPVTTEELFPFIDRMPMRAREIRENRE